MFDRKTFDGHELMFFNSSDALDLLPEQINKTLQRVFMSLA